MNIVILYEHIVRELDAVTRLGKIIKKRGHNCVCFSGDFEVTRAYHYAKKNKVDVILMPWFVDDEHYDLIMPIIKTNPNIKIINLHHEQISSEVYEEVLFPHSELTENNSYHFAWGDYFKKQLISRGTPESRIFVTGNIRNDKAFVNSVTRKQLAEKYGLNQNKKWILYAENRGFASMRMNESLKIALRNRGLTDEEILESMNNSRDGLNSFFEILRSLPVEFLKKYEFIYRPHPGTQIEETFPEGVHLICELPIYDWILNSDLFVTCESTSIFEAEVCGIPCVTYNNLPASKKFQMAGVDKYPKLEKLTDINDELIERIKKEQSEKHIYQEYLGIVDGHAADRAADAIELISSQDSVINNYGHTLSKKVLIRRYLYEFLTWVSVKTGLLNKIKFPRSSYWSSRDIPYTKQNEEIYFKKY